MRDYSVLFGLAALGLIVGGRRPSAPQRPASAPADASGEGQAQQPTDGTAAPEELPGPAAK